MRCPQKTRPGLKNHSLQLIMETHRRRQHRSCDQCRKGKRACDAPVRRTFEFKFSSTYGNSTAYRPCSKCKRLKKECTFNWLFPFGTASQTPHEKKSEDSSSSTRGDADISSVHKSQKQTLVATSHSPRLLPDDPTLGVSPVFSLDPPFIWSTRRTSSVCSPAFQDTNPGDGEIDENSENIRGSLDYVQISSQTIPSYFNNNIEATQTFENSSLGLNGFSHSSVDFESLESSDDAFDSFSAEQSTTAPGIKDQNSFLFPSDNIAGKYARTTMTENLLRIYHDSMENALSCWLTERNCPYSSTVPSSSTTENLLLNGIEREWGPNWSNRICARVCRLDRSYSSVRGRSLTVSEEKAAARTLHTAIMAFASQWDQHSQERTVSGVLNDIGDLGIGLDTHSERSIKVNLWNQAHNALNNSAGIPSFRIVFANIIFSLTQRPLNIGEQIRMMSCDASDGVPVQLSGKGSTTTGVAEMNELFDNDRAPMFLETAIRQLFAFRYKLTRQQRHASKSWIGPSGHSAERMADGISPTSNIPHVDPILANPEYCETFNLLFWLAVMFDTLTAAIHQRPPVVSDEDSQITCVAPTISHMTTNGSQFDLDSWSFMPNLTSAKKKDLWGDLFLSKSAASQNSGTPRWPCSYAEAAETLSDAAPVKVLLFRRVAHLQTLVYRGVGPETLEEAIQGTFSVYQHWNCTYNQFMLDCIAHHDDLPPRVQSWYVILAAHWHLAAILLADTLESIDRAMIGLDSQRELRSAIDPVVSLKRKNALAVSSLAQCSLHGQDPSFSKLGQFHDSVKHGAFLSEPWTVVLMRSFTRAGYILLNDMDMSTAAFNFGKNDSQEQSRRQCQFCIDALLCLGRKSDMALLAARALSNSLNGRLRKSLHPNSVVIPDNFAENHVQSVFDDYDLETPVSSVGRIFS